MLRFLNHPRFLLRCKKYNVIPNFKNLKYNINGSSFVNHAICRSYFTMIRAVIKEACLNISKLEKELYHLHLKLAHNIHNFSSIVSKSWNHAENRS